MGVLPSEKTGRNVLIVLAALFIVAVIVFVLVKRSAQREPEFYSERLAIPPAVAEEESGEMVRRVTAVASNVEKPGAWEATFTEAQINGWLAVDLPRNHAQAIPRQISDPRIRIDPKRLTIVFRYDGPNFSGVPQVTIDAYLVDENTLAIRFLDFHAGALPLPEKVLMDAVAQVVARHGRVQLRWEQADGDPVAVLEFDLVDWRRDLELAVEEVRLDEASVYIAGRTGPLGGE